MQTASVEVSPSSFSQHAFPPPPPKVLQTSILERLINAVLTFYNLQHAVIRRCIFAGQSFGCSAARCHEANCSPEESLTASYLGDCGPGGRSHVRYHLLSRRPTLSSQRAASTLTSQ